MARLTALVDPEAGNARLVLGLGELQRRRLGPRSGRRDAARLTRIQWDPDEAAGRLVGLTVTRRWPRPLTGLGPKRRSAARGVEFNDDTRLLRVVTGFDALRGFFALGVNYGPSSPNAHRLELYVLDGDGAVDREFARVQWEPDEVGERLAALAAASPTVSSSHVGETLA